jgi:hypothetical protein
VFQACKHEMSVWYTDQFHYLDAMLYLCLLAWKWIYVIRQHLRKTNHIIYFDTKWCSQWFICCYWDIFAKLLLAVIGRDTQTAKWLYKPTIIFFKNRESGLKSLFSVVPLSISSFCWCSEIRMGKVRVTFQTEYWFIQWMKACYQSELLGEVVDWEV